MSIVSIIVFVLAALSLIFSIKSFLGKNILWGVIYLVVFLLLGGTGALGL